MPVSSNSQKKKQSEKKPFASVGEMSLVGSVLIGKNVSDRGYLSGREKLYHKTHKKNIASILEQGLLGRYAEDPNNITNRILADTPMDKKRGLVYLARNKQFAKYDVATDDYLKAIEALRRGDAQAFQKYLKKHLTDYEVLKARVPTWKMNLVRNPETESGVVNFINRSKKKNFKSLSDARQNLGLPNLLKLLKAYHDLDKNTVTIKGDVAPQYIKNSPKYQRLTLNEVVDYIKHRPGRFAKGVGLSALSAGLGIYGVKNVLDNIRSKNNGVKNNGVKNLSKI